MWLADSLVCGSQSTGIVNICKQLRSLILHYISMWFDNILHIKHHAYTNKTIIFQIGCRCRLPACHKHNSMRMNITESSHHLCATHWQPCAGVRCVIVENKIKVNFLHYSHCFSIVFTS